jgi:hypothetical protein
MPRRFFFVILLTCTFLLVRPLSARAETQIVMVSSDYVFTKSLDLQFGVQSTSPVTSAVVYVRVRDGLTGFVPLTIEPDGPGVFLLQVTVDLATLPIQPFSQVDYHFEAALEDGSSIRSPDYTFQYLDNRFNWQSFEKAPLRVFWYGRDASFGQNILNIAFKGIERVQELSGTIPLEPVDIYVYSSNENYHSVQMPEWSSLPGRRAVNPTDVIMVVLPEGPDQTLLAEQRLPHQLMTLYLERISANEGVVLPAYFVEGISIMAELYPNPEHLSVLDHSLQQDGLIPLSILCTSYPSEPTKAFLANAQSASFIRFLVQRYGVASIRSLLQTYLEGKDCENGLAITFNASLKELENEWHQDLLGRESTLPSTSQLSPWIILILAISIAPLIVILSKLRRYNIQEV